MTSKEIIMLNRKSRKRLNSSYPAHIATVTLMVPPPRSPGDPGDRVASFTVVFKIPDLFPPPFLLALKYPVFLI